MTRLLLVIILALSSGPVYAGWVAVEKDYFSPGLQTLYVDPDTITKDGNLVSLWQLTDYKWMQGNPRGTPRFLSTKTHKQFDCTNQRLRMLAFTEFSRHMGTGIMANGSVDTAVWLSIEPESVNQALAEIACGKQ
jgi:hypothetical protein